MSSLDPSVKLYRETPCEHGYVDGHGPYVGDDLIGCLGGSREEVTIEQLVFMVANACASHDMQSGPFDMLAELDTNMSDAYKRFARKHVDAALHTERETASTVSGSN